MTTEIRTATGGCWPVMLTPFKTDKSIDWDSLDHLIEWYLQAGCKGLFAVCQSSEMFYLNHDERLALAQHVVIRVAKDIPVIATGTFSENISEQADFIKLMYETGVDAVVLLTNFMSKQNDPESIWLDNTKSLLEKTDNVPLGMYECPLPYKRLIPKDTMMQAALTERFFWSKDTSEDILQIREKLQVIKDTNLSLYNAHTASLLLSLQSGGCGFSGIAANLYPELFSWLCEYWEIEPDIAEELQQFLIWAQQFVDHKYPLSAKQLLVLKNVIKETSSRLNKPDLNSDEIVNLKNLNEQVELWRKRLGIVAV